MRPSPATGEELHAPPSRSRQSSSPVLPSGQANTPLSIQAYTSPRSTAATTPSAPASCPPTPALVVCRCLPLKADLSLPNRLLRGRVAVQNFLGPRRDHPAPLVGCHQFERVDSGGQVEHLPTSGPESEAALQRLLTPGRGLAHLAL